MSIIRGISELVKRCSVPVTVQERSTGQLQEGSAASKKKDMWSTVVTRKISGLVTRRISGLLTRITTVVNYCTRKISGLVTRRISGLDTRKISGLII